MGRSLTDILRPTVKHIKLMRTYLAASCSVEAAALEALLVRTAQEQQMGLDL